MSWLSIDGRTLFAYGGFAHGMYNLLHEDHVLLFLAYVQETPPKELSGVFCIHGMLKDGQTFIVPRIRLIYGKIDWSDQSQDHASFLKWLEDVFKPLLDKIRPIIPNIDQLVDDNLSEGNVEQTLEFMLTELRKHCRPGQSASAKSAKMHEDS
jgi:hypothetical protein